jgi:hypothetical protein
MEDDITKSNNDWLQRTWRPAVGVTYIVINVFDFILFPILWSAISIYTEGVVKPWQPLTLETTGLFHLSFGAILGVAAWSRGQEKLAGVDYYSAPRIRPRRDRFDSDDDYREPASTFRGEQ